MGRQTLDARRSTIDTAVITDRVVAVTDKAILLDQFAHVAGRFGRSQQEWIAKSQIVEADCEIDDIEVNEEVTIEIPRWLSRRLGAE